MSITPALGARLVGFRGRATGCTSIHDELYGTALVLEDENEQLVILSCDLLSVHPRIVARVRELLRSTLGIRADRVMICCSHTHSGPPGYATRSSHPIDQAYVERLPDTLASAVRIAQSNLRPARADHDSGEATIGINRREVIGEGETILGNNPDGPLDREVGVLRVDSAEGAPLATLVNYACHPVILGPQSLAVSADFVGKTREVVEAATGAPMLFVQGACGDINPIGGVTAEYTNCRDLGTTLGDEVVRVWSGIEPRQTQVRLTAHSCQLELPVRTLPDQAPLWDRNLEDALDKEFPWAAEMGEEGVKTEVQALALADLAMVSAAAEPFVETGLAIKAASPFARTFFGGYANGCVGYVPTAQSFPHRGYEITQAPVFYRLPASIAPEAEQMMVRACVNELERASPEA